MSRVPTWSIIFFHYFIRCQSTRLSSSDTYSIRQVSHQPVSVERAVACHIVTSACVKMTQCGNVTMSFTRQLYEESKSVEHLLLSLLHFPGPFRISPLRQTCLQFTVLSWMIAGVGIMSFLFSFSSLLGFGLPLLHSLDVLCLVM